MTPDAMTPFGLALQDYFQGNKEAAVFIVRDDGLREEMKIAPYFRSKSDFSELEILALETAFGRVLDLGAGTGVHSLELQASDHEVTALDISKHACDIMTARGITHVICGDLYDQEQSPNFDTILSLGRSIGFVGDLEGMVSFLQFAHSLLAENGQILFDSCDIRTNNDPIHVQYRKKNMQSGRYFGEIRFQIEFQGQLGEMFRMLQIDPITLQKICEETGWQLEVIYKGNRGDYLANISRK